MFGKLTGVFNKNNVWLSSVLRRPCHAEWIERIKTNTRREINRSYSIQLQGNKVRFK